MEPLDILRWGWLVFCLVLNPFAFDNVRQAVIDVYRQDSKPLISDAVRAETHGSAWVQAWAFVGLLASLAAVVAAFLEITGVPTALICVVTFSLGMLSLAENRRRKNVAELLEIAAAAAARATQAQQEEVDHGRD